ncbi:hypothetical protein [Nocardia sp. NPDC050710]|uniref:hypothetical protein n=1 Tax=Nocardia sp. NPDC050710 TaxID=3157220 RepID=UPI0033C1B05F
MIGFAGFATRSGGILNSQGITIGQERRLPDTATLLRRFSEGGPASAALMREVDPATVVAHPRGDLRALAEVAVVDRTVHLLDLIAAVGGPPVPEPALRFTSGVLAAVPDSVAFIEAATGRGVAPVLLVIRSPR